MKITWYGHAAFCVETGGVRILTDPYSSRIGFAPIAEAFDIVTLSHHNPDYHSCLEEVLGDPQVLHGLELSHSGQAQVLEGVRFGAVEVAEDVEGNGPNAMVWMEAGGLRVLHMGDCGYQPTPEQVAACGQVDVLLALAGAGPTLSIDALLNFIEALKPSWVLPMHYGTPQLKTMSLAPIEELEEAFAGRFGAERVRRSSTPTVDVPGLGGPAAPTLVVVPAAR